MPIMRRTVSKNLPSHRFPLAMAVSLFIHVALVIFLSLTPWPTALKAIPKTYLVAWVSPSVPELEAAKPTPALEKKETLRPVEKMKPVEKPKKNDIVEKIKKKERKEEPLHHLQESLEEIRKKAALAEIQKKVAKRETPSPTLSPSPPPPTPPQPSLSPSTPPPLPPPISPSLLEAKLNEYYSLLWVKIKESWTIPESLLKERLDLETIIVIIIDKDGKILKSWFEKRSGNALYDQMAMRAIRKSEPFPPFPKEWKESTLEVGIRFYPE